MKISIVTTLYLSEDYVREFYQRAVKAVANITDDYEFIFVNDGSPDNSLAEALKLQQTDDRVVVVDLSRNFGHHRAIMTGLQYSSGDHVFLIDSDLEESPSLLNEYWNELKNGVEVDVVYGLQERRKGRWPEVILGKIWYGLFKLLSDIEYPANSLTARLMTRRYVDNVLRFTERELEIWGVFVLTGFTQKTVTTTKGSKGSTSYCYSRKIRMAVDSITSFSSKPLIAAFVLGMGMSLISFCFLVYFVFQWLLLDAIPSGWTSTLVSIWLVGGILMFFMGVIGIYLSKMFKEIKARPMSIVREVYGGSRDADTGKNH